MAVRPEGCISGVGQDLDNCAERRGAFFSPDVSTSFERVGGNQFYNMPVDAEQYLGIPSATAEVGYDNVSLGLTPGTQSGYALGNQTLFSYAVKQPFLGTFGLRLDPVRLPGFSDVHDSALATIQKSGKILSNSWSYTAGAQYRPRNAFASLTLGGRDLAKFDAKKTVGFQIGIDHTRDLLVTMTNVAISSDADSAPSGSPLPLIMYVDSTITPIYMPQTICNYFESAFGLVWDNSSSLYLVNDTQHNRLTQFNPNVTFTIASPSGLVDFVLPYAAFDLTASYPVLGDQEDANRTSRYFPLQRAQNSSQYALGRTFLQEAYLMVDYDRQNFSLSPTQYLSANPQPGQQSTLDVIYPPGYRANVTETQPEGSKGISSGAKAGIAIAVVVIAILAAIAAFFFLRRRRRQRKAEKEQPNADGPLPHEIGETKPPDYESAESNSDRNVKGYYGPAVELQGSQAKLERHEMPAREGPSELDDSRRAQKTPAGTTTAAKNRGSTVYELDADKPVSPQIGGLTPANVEAGSTRGVSPAPPGSPEVVSTRGVSPAPAGSPEAVGTREVSPAPVGSPEIPSTRGASPAPVSPPNHPVSPEPGSPPTASLGPVSPVPTQDRDPFEDLPPPKTSK